MTTNTTKTLSQIRTMESAGFRYHAFGAIRKGRKLVAEWYKGDSISEAQKATIRSTHPKATFGVSACQYAPEIRGAVVIFNR